MLERAKNLARLAWLSHIENAIESSMTSGSYKQNKIWIDSLLAEYKRLGGDTNKLETLLRTIYSPEKIARLVRAFEVPFSKCRKNKKGVSDNSSSPIKEEVSLLQNL